MRQAKPVVVSVEMGYGHLRAALPLSEALGTELLHVDRAPFADAEEQRLWARVRKGQELLSKPTQLSNWLFDPTRLMDKVTKIPSFHARTDHSQPSIGARMLDFLVTRGLGRGLVRHLRATGAPLITTFYAPAIIADRAGCDNVYCVVTDADINRVWAPMNGRHSRIHYFAPSARVVRRLLSYGVAKERVTLTGFPLPRELLGGVELSTLRQNLARRLVRLDPRGTFRQLYRSDIERLLGPIPEEEQGAAPVLTFAVGGAGAQAEMADDFLPNLRDSIVAGHFRVNLIAGTRLDVAERFLGSVRRSGLEAQLGKGVHVIRADDFETYYRKFNLVLKDTDILWTKPSELSFYAALGIPLVLAKPVGSHERFNRKWLRAQGVALKQETVKHAAAWLEEWLEDGTLAAAAWSGFVRMAKDGTYRVIEQVRNDENAVNGVSETLDASGIRRLG